MRIAVPGGDGIGPAVTRQAVKALRAVAAHGPPFSFAEAPIGDAADDTTGEPLPEATAALAERADGGLFGAAGPATST
jgi:3-isopropylmalate dehydrogenase